MRGSQRSPPNSCTLSWAACALSGAHDHILHGVPFRREDLSVEWRDGFDILTNQPSILVSALMADCEIQFANWPTTRQWPALRREQVASGSSCIVFRARLAKRWTNP